MKIYTKNGDTGQTSLLGGKRVDKHHIRIDAYGTVDELNSHLGWLRDSIVQLEFRVVLLEIQDRLFTLGSHLALDPEHVGKMNLPVIEEKDITLLEKKMDEMDSVLPELKNFVLPGGFGPSSHCHVARCVCRRAERGVSGLEIHSEQDKLALKYLNRLSDYLFVLARTLVVQSGAEEIPWKPRIS